MSSFLNNYKTVNRNKRQVGILAVGLGAILGFGINEWQIQHINSVISDLKSESIHRDSKIKILETTVYYNSKMVYKLQRV